MCKGLFSEEISRFFSSQLNEWGLAGNNYLLLEKVKKRTLHFGDFDVFVQFNPERIRSTAAKTDSGSVKDRPCFLCQENRPVQQRGVPFDEEFIVLVNPFPIFRRHLTIASSKHTGQVIMNNFGTMLSLAEALPDYVIFYNGPRCGASAPDHLHFQAGNRGFMPIETDFDSKQFTHPAMTGPGIEIFNWTGYLRGIITIKGSERKLIESLFYSVFKKLFLIRVNEPESRNLTNPESQIPSCGSQPQPQPEPEPEPEPEPMLNILSYKSDEHWIVHIIPRKKHRPLQFFAEEKDRLILSPASVDLGGVLITPREEDYNMITENDIEDIFRQVCFGEEEMYSIIMDLL